MSRADRDTRRGGNGLELATAQWRAEHRFDIDLCGLCAHRGQGLDLFAKALLHGGQEGGQCIAGHRRLGHKLQHLATTCAEAEQLAQAFDRHGAHRAIDDTYADIAVKTFRQLRQDLGRARVQAVGVGQGNTGAGPVRRQFTAQHFQHRAAAGGASQLVAAPFNQQGTQAFKQGLVRFTEARQAEQAVQGLAEVTHRFVRRHKGQARALDRLLAVQPPQAIAQGQRVDLLQYGGKAIAHAVGLAQQARTAPHQLFKIIGRHAQADHLRIQRQFLGRALQQFQQRFGTAGTAQRLAQVGFTEGTGEQLQQAQVFIGFSRDANRQIDDLAIAPVHPFGELQQAHTGGKHLVAGFWRAMGDSNALAEKGRTLGFTGLQATEITFGNQAIGH
ncbi:hypothetical protein PFLmoz3_00078 [Pseudomonas fluorescens]|uniref:Uncharacterized protein n=1 Tax=Pseudomonas fluorescens TaxID=294 RepID=A0A109LLK7_PSEFL|nr:hypothetical protein PFLmoz3_00078 [Pseudomonas fluorescens]